MQRATAQWKTKQRKDICPIMTNEAPRLGHKDCTVSVVVAPKKLYIDNTKRKDCNGRIVNTESDEPMTIIYGGGNYRSESCSKI